MIVGNLVSRFLFVLFMFEFSFNRCRPIEVDVLAQVSVGVNESKPMMWLLWARRMVRYDFYCHSFHIRQYCCVMWQFKCCGAGSYTDWFYRDNASAGLGAISRTDACTSAVDFFAAGEGWLFAASSIVQLVPDSCCISMCKGCARRTHPSNIFFDVSWMQ